MNTLLFMQEHPEYFADFVTRNTYHSNAIEGSTLSYAETYAILWNDNSLRVTATARELYEAINHKYAMATASENSTEDLSENLIKRIAKDINRNISGIDNYRKTAVYIRGAEHLPPEANQVNQRMMQLVYDYNHSVIEDPFLKESQFHIQFERIHPFEDGNGRTGRILINRGLMRSGVAPVVIPLEERAEYMEHLAASDYEGLADMLRRLSEFEEKRMQHFSDLQLFIYLVSVQISLKPFKIEAYFVKFCVLLDSQNNANYYIRKIMRICSLTVMRICEGVLMVDALEIGYAIKDRRAQLGLTQAEVAKAAGISSRCLWSLELGRNTGVQLNKLLAVFKVLGLDFCIKEVDETQATVQNKSDEDFNVSEYLEQRFSGSNAKVDFDPLAILMGKDE